MRLQQIYQRGVFKIYKSEGFILHNTDKEFSQGHTHLNSFKIAKYLIELITYKRIPRHLSKYLLVSLIRVSDDTEYQRKINELISNKKRKQNCYRGKMHG